MGFTYYRHQIPQLTEMLKDNLHSSVFLEGTVTFANGVQIKEGKTPPQVPFEEAFDRTEKIVKQAIKGGWIVRRYPDYSEWVNEKTGEKEFAIRMRIVLLNEPPLFYKGADKELM